MKKTWIRIAGLLALAPLVCGAARPQEGPVPPQASSQEDLQQQLIDLIHEVERRLAAIDTKLSDAGAGVVPLDGVEDSGLDDLLRQAQRQSQQNVEDIDRILEIASQMNSQQQGSQSSQQQQQPQPGESPLDQERDRGPQERENTPSEPQQEQGQEEQQQGEQQGEQQQDQPSDNPRDGENREGEVRPDSSGAGPSSADDANRWGELPVRYREVFRNQGGEELPVQYRDWIDAYHRRLSKSRR